MAQGKKFTKEQRQEVIESLRPYLEVGFSRARACKMVGLNESTLSRWLTADEVLGMKVEGWENSINKLVMANLLDALRSESRNEEDTKKETSKWWAERRMKEDFSTRTEKTGADGKDLYINPELRAKVEQALDDIDE